MRLRRAMVWLLILTLTGCAGPKLPWQREDPSLEPIHSAYQLLMSNYVDRPEGGALLSAAFDGAKRVLADAGIADGSLQEPDWSQGQDANWERFSQAYAQLTGKYAKQVGSDKLEHAAIGHMAASLKDCQTHFYDPEAMKQRQDEVAGQQAFGGIGVLMKNIPDHPTILRVMDGPARAEGLKPGDEILAVDGKSTAGQSFQEVRNRIRGPEGSKVRVTVKRPGETVPRDFDVSRAQIQAPVIDIGFAAGGSVGYIHLYSFPRSVLPEIDAALQVFDERGVSGVILDVRANTGGDQQTMLSAMGRFIKSGTVEVLVDRSGQQKPFSVDASQYWSHPKPLVVLADEDTQSGGEMFVKAMQEEGGYQVVGAQTSGCAGSGRMFELGDGSGLEISTAKVMSGRGQEIHRVGVKPDVPAALSVQDLAAGRDPQIGAALGVLQQVAGASTDGAAADGQSGAAAGGVSVLKPLGPSPSAAPPARILK